MKKIKKLALKRESLRIMGDLSDVRGGNPDMPRTYTMEAACPTHNVVCNVSPPPGPSPSGVGSQLVCTMGFCGATMQPQ